MFSRLKSLWRNLVHRRSREQDLSAELASYLELLVAEKIAAGLSPAEAERQARRELGSVAEIQEQVRDVRAGQGIAVFGRDLFAAARSLLRGSWTVPAVAILTIAIGIAAITNVFSLVYGILLRPLALPEADRLVILNSRFLPESGYDFPLASLSGPEFTDFRAQNRSLSGVAGLSYGSVSVGAPGSETALVRSLRASANLFDVLRVAPILGRGFTAEEDRFGAACVAVVSFGLWQEQFGSDRGIVDREVTVDGRGCRIVGVMPKDFRFPDERVRIWFPLGLDPVSDRQSHGLLAVGRLADGVTSQRLEADLAVIRKRWEAEFPTHHRGHFVVARPLLDTLIGSTRPTLLALFGAVVALLAGICINLTGVNLVRTEARRREIAVRLALGGRRGDVVRLVLLESGLLATAGGVLGWLAAWGTGGAIPRLVPGGLPRSDAVVMDGHTVAFAALVTGAIALVLGVSSGLAASRVRVDEAWHGGQSRTVVGSRSARRTRAGLVVAQVALGLSLSLTALGLIAGYRRLRQVDLGFEGRGVTALSLYLPEGRFPSWDAVRLGFDGVLERVGAIPGVAVAGIISGLPLESTGSFDDFKIEGVPEPGPGRGRSAEYFEVSPNLFRALAIPLKRGRLLEPADEPGSQLVAVVNEALVRKHFDGRDPLGQRIRYFGETTPWLTIVGVVGDVRSNPGDPPYPAVYVSYRQLTRPLIPISRSMSVVVRTAGDPTGLPADIRSAVAAAVPGAPISRMRPMPEVVDAASGSVRFAMTMMTGFAATVVLLAALGIYGLLAYAVAARQRETGIRMALGADRATVGIAVVRSGLALTGIGIAIGVTVALTAAPVISRFLFEIRISSPVTVVLSAGILLVVAIAASAIPALRAARLEPRAALAEE